VRCEACRAEFLVAFRCKGRQFCPSCHARRLAEWSLWLDERLLLDVPHRQVVLTLPKRLRPYFSYDHRRLGGLSRVAYHTLSRYLQAGLGERDLAPGAIVCAQTFGALAHWHPHLHVLLTDGAFAPDGGFRPAPPHHPAVLQESFRRAVLAWFAHEGWLEREAADRHVTFESRVARAVDLAARARQSRHHVPLRPGQRGDQAPGARAGRRYCEVGAAAAVEAAACAARVARFAVKARRAEREVSNEHHSI
jgi:hypothetical protein